MEKISIVIPVYNSSASLQALSEEIDSHFNHSAYSIEKIFVDDYSTDDSHQVLMALSERLTSKQTMKILRLKKNVGQQNAIFCGLKYASGDYIVTMDDDLQHDVAYVDGMVDALKKGADLVYGIEKESPKTVRSFGSKLTAFFFRKTFKALKGQRVSSFRAFGKKELAGILSCKYSFIYLSALLLTQVGRVENIEIIKRERPYGVSGYNYKKLAILFLKLTYYYGNIVPERLKPEGAAYEEAYDIRSWQLPVECH